MTKRIPSPGPASQLRALLGQALALHRQGRIGDAKAIYEAVLERDRQNAEALSGLGIVALQSGAFGAALELLDRSIKIAPNVAFTHYNRAMALEQLKRQPEALTSYGRAISLKPDFAEAHNNRGNLLLGMNRPAEALASFDAALAHRAGDGQIWSNRGNALRQLKRLEDARASYVKGQALNASHAETHYNLGIVLLEQGDAAGALACFERAIALQPDFPDAHCNLIFTLNFLPGENTASQQARRKIWNDTIANRLIPKTPPRPVADANDGQRKLRIGYVSGHFRHQAAIYAFGSVILYHDPNRFEVFCYSDSKLEDDVTALLKAKATTWRPTHHLNDEQLAAQIRSDGIDILVDCVGHMDGNRLLAFARRPAPVQITGWGEPTGTGLTTMDYLVADPVLLPLAERPLLSEAVIDLPCYLSYWSPDEPPPPGAVPAMAAGHITFGSFNRAAKLTAPTLELWARVLAAVPSSRLLLKSATWVDATERTRLIQRMERLGVAAERIAFIGETTRAEHFMAYQSVDVCLDPLPHSGGMTTVDALWMGSPVITLPGATPSSRLAASVLTALDLSEWIAKDAADYVAIASALAADLARLSGVRGDLRGRVQHSAIGDLARYAKALEDRYQEIWKARQDQQI